MEFSKKGIHVLSIMAALLIFVASFSACSTGNDVSVTPDPTPSQASSQKSGMTGDDEFDEEDANVTSQVILQDANAAELIFLDTPDIELFAEQIKTTRDNGLIGATGLADMEGSYSRFVSEKPNQLAAAGSGFEFSLNTKSNATDTLRPAIGFSSMFYFTAGDDNLGSDAYNALLAACEKLQVQEGGWVIPESSVLTDLGIHVFTMYKDAPSDITDRASFGLNLSEKEDGKIMINYGAVMVDGDIGDFSAEGKPLYVSDEGEITWNDGAQDGKITAIWWIGKAQ